MELDTSFIDFGLVQCGTESSQIIHIKNKGNTKLDWNLEEIPITVEQPLRWKNRRRRKAKRTILETINTNHIVRKRGPLNRLTCEPSSGVLKAGKSVEVKVFLFAGEMIAATEGLAYRIALLRRHMGMDLILPYVLWVALLVFLVDLGMRWLNKRLHPWFREA